MEEKKVAAKAAAKAKSKAGFTWVLQNTCEQVDINGVYYDQL